jgi:hypothetical protein
MYLLPAFCMDKDTIISWSLEMRSTLLLNKTDVWTVLMTDPTIHSAIEVEPTNTHSLIGTIHT